MGFDPKKHLIRVQGGREYLPVAWRLVWFREEKPDWGIDTKPIVVDVDKGIAVFQANVFDAEGRLMASGTKMETARGFGDFIEKAETGSIGRALGVLGYGTQFAPEFDEDERIVDSPQRPAPRGQGKRPPQGAHQDAAEPHNPIGVGFSACEECSRPLTKGQADFSTMRFGRPLCPAHQTKAPKAEASDAPAPAAAALGRLRFTAEKRGLTDADLVNMAGERYGAESLEELERGSIADLESHIRSHYEERKRAAA